mgnify:CR=1 FL=1
MRTTTNQAISLLGSIAMLNERIIAFINECYPREKYCLIKNIDKLIIEKVSGILLQANVDITLDCRSLATFLQEVLCEALKIGDYKTAKEADELCKNLLELELEIKDGK